MTTLFGKTSSELDAEKTIQCREIVTEIMKFGVSQRQLLKIIQLLSLEIEDRTALNSIYDTVSAILNETETSKQRLLIG